MKTRQNCTLIVAFLITSSVIERARCFSFRLQSPRALCSVRSANRERMRGTLQKSALAPCPALIDLLTSKMQGQLQGAAWTENISSDRSGEIPFHPTRQCEINSIGNAFKRIATQVRIPARRQTARCPSSSEAGVGAAKRMPFTLCPAAAVGRFHGTA